MKLKFPRGAVVALALCAAASAQINLYAVLDGAQETPPVPTAATGVGRLTFNENGTCTYLVTTTGFSSAITNAHLHIGAVGVPGGVVFGLTQTAPGVPEWRGTSPVLSAANKAALLTDGCYFNIHTGNFPGGEIRGQAIVVRRSRFKATLDGAQETPPVATAVVGTAEAWLVEPENVLTYEVSAPVSGFAFAHIHDGAPGVAGPVIQPLNGVNTHYCGSMVLTAAEVTSLKAGNTYFNVHTAANPGGEVRGQILAANELFTTFCNGAQETPPNASTHTACGTFVLNAAAGTLSYSITTSLPAITAMHLHTGAPGTSGGVAIGLTGTPPVMTGTTPALTATQLLNLRRGNLYLNLHTMAFSGGEIRGNLRHGGEPYGFGSPDGVGAAPRVEVFGYAGVGSTFDVVLLDAAPSSATFAFVGTQGAFWPAAASALPFDGSGFGATSAFIWTDWDPTFFFPLATDAEGCAKLNISLPALPLFDCFRVAVQFFTVDVGANPFGASVSDAINFRFAPATFPY